MPFHTQAVILSMTILARSFDFKCCMANNKYANALKELAFPG